MLNRLLLSLFAARKQNYIIIYIRHYKICKKQRKLQLCMYNKKLISSQRQIKGKLAAANDLTFYKNLVLGANPNRDKEND